MIVPAVKGTTSLLASALAHGTNVKRIIQLSSISAVHNRHASAQAVYTEKHWNDKSVQLCETEGKGASGGDKYDASKTLSERAAWEFVEKNKGAVKWDLVSVNPSLILGPALQEVESVEKLNTSLVFFFMSLLGPGDAKDTARFTTPSYVPFILPPMRVLTYLFSGMSWVDIRDVADAVIAGLKVEQAGGERFIITESPYSWQDWRT